MDSLFGKLKHEAVKLKREAKKVAELETPLEKKLREATSNQNWGCPNSVLYDIATAAKDFHDRRKILCKMEEKLQSEPHRWRRIYKTLCLLEFIIKNGSEDILPDMLAEQSKVRRFTSFSYLEEGKERGEPIRQKANAILELAGNRSLLRAAREEAQAHRSKMSGEGSRESGGRAPRPESHGTSRASMEQRFNELKKKRDAENRKAETLKNMDLNSTRDTSPSEKSRDNKRSSETKCIKLAPPGSSPNREKEEEEEDREEPVDNGFVLFDGAGGPQSDSDSDGPPSRSKAPMEEEQKEQVPSPPNDLLDLMGGSDDPPQASQDWANFASSSVSGTTPSDLLGGLDAPPQQNTQAVDMFADTSFQAAAPPTGAFGQVQAPPFGQMQAPIFTGPVNPAPFVVAPQQLTYTSGYVAAPPAPVASPFDGPWAQTSPPPGDSSSGVTPPSTSTVAPPSAPTFLDDMPGELWDLNLTGAKASAKSSSRVSVPSF